MMKAQIQHPELLVGLVGDRDDEGSNTTPRATSRPGGSLIISLSINTMVMMESLFSADNICAGLSTKSVEIVLFCSL